MKYDKQSVLKDIHTLVEYGLVRTCLDIRMPDTRGALNNVFFVKTPWEDYVFKLTHPELAKKNKLMAGVMRNNWIPVPDVKIMQINGKVFETYPLIKGSTLFERISAGEYANSDILSAYQQMLRVVARMEFINKKSLPDMKLLHCHKIGLMNVGDTNGAIMGHAISAAVYALNRGNKNDYGVYHFDLTPKNVIFNDKKQLVSLIDMDAVGLCDRSFALAMMCAKYSAMGYPVGELFDFYEHISHRDLKRGRINRMIDLLNMGKTMLWRTRQKHTTR